MFSLSLAPFLLPKMQIRNIAIIAHVDHGKTTLTDALMKQTGMVEEGFSMDVNALEQERGITIYAKNASLYYPSASSRRPAFKKNNLILIQNPFCLKKKKRSLPPSRTKPMKKFLSYSWTWEPQMNSWIS